VLLAAAALAGCDRNIEPFVPGEEPRQPDLSKIFPAGAEQAGTPRPQPGIPPLPRESRGGADASASAAPIEGTVSVPDHLRGSLPDGAVLFLIARRGAAGPPLAVQRIGAPSLPLRFSIGPADRMIPSIPFEGPLQLSARLDADGDAMSRKPGDLQGTAEGSFSPGARGVSIVLDEIL
jgi:hypothetical protein